MYLLFNIGDHLVHDHPFTVELMKAKQLKIIEIIHPDMHLGHGDGIDDLDRDDLALEGLVLGITGKQALWAALAVAADAVPQLRELDYAQLQKRAAEQCDRVEAKRLEVAREAFGVD